MAMLYSLAADLVTALHLAFVLFVLLGGFMAWRWRRVIYAHLPSVLWGALIEFNGWICPLTPLENYLRMKAGAATYAGSFTEHYILLLIYPTALTSQDKLLIGSGILAINLAVYGFRFSRLARRVNTL